MPIKKTDNPRTKLFEEQLAKIEQALETPIFALVSDEIIEPHWVTDIYAARKQFEGSEQIAILLDSIGGDLHSAFRLIRLFRHFCKKIRIIIPLYAKSAATLFSLGADEVLMSPIAQLGPTDPQTKDPRDKKQSRSMSPLEGFKALEFLRLHAWETLDTTTTIFQRGFRLTKEEAMKEAREFISVIMGPLYNKVDPRDFGQYSRSLAISEEYAKRILEMRGVPQETASPLIRRLVWGYPSHGFSIDYLEAKSLGMPVEVLKGTEEDAVAELIPTLLFDEKNPLEYIGFIKPPVVTEASPDELRAEERT